jgi:16S rRNA (guanine966-N2)-methyltransferase
MRVISGTAKGRKLKRVPGDSTRPIMDRVKESLFNIVREWTGGARWYDMFGGTGAVGIEALSRGAAEVTFTDNTRAAILTIIDNLKHTRLDSHAIVRQIDAFQFVREYQGVPFDLIYVAPPQYKSLWRDALLLLDETVPTILLADGLVVVQIDPREYEEQTLQNLILYDQRTYGTTMLCFYERPAADTSD